ncbi:MAG: CRISPR-associated helicase Cas3' [Caldilineaceae bacterium]|nr:CRISPR-associated helicase Cas3' [Caldilineaceae bacterium]
MSHAKEKATRLLQIERLLWAHPEGLTRAEIARRIHVHRATITKYLDKDQLPPGIYEDDLDGNKLKLDRSSDLTRASFNLHEIMAIHLATRLLATRTDKQNPHAASALRKLGAALQRLDHNVSRHLLRSADVMDEDAAYRDPVYLEALQALTEAWAAGRKVQVSHQMPDGKVFDYKFAPYFIEPYAVGQTAHVIGLREPPGKVRTFKIERLRSVEILREEYTIPDDFDPATLLRSAWGIWYSEAEPVEVVLRFHPSVAHRVQETRWHRHEASPQIQSDGHLLWRAMIAEPQEMLPWIRGWGADVEVLTPAWLRQEIAREARRLGELYAVSPSPNRCMQYYAHSKEGTNEAEWQRLKDHLVASGDLAFALGRDAGVSHLAKVAGLLHDIGKYSQAFQDRLRGSKRLVDHATAGAREVMTLFPDPPHRHFAELISYCIAGHHSGLPDYGSMGDTEIEGTLLARREKKKLEDYGAYRSEIELAALEFQPPRIKSSRLRFGDRQRAYDGFSISFLTRMVFSVLVDADWLETERFMLGEANSRGKHATLEALAYEFEQYMKRFANPQSAINRKRTETLHACLAKANQEAGFFTLTVPTGGAKTLASMAFALKHAVARELKRIIYVIPFTSIIEQNAAVFREAFGSLGQENVLEHHANLDWEQLRQDGDQEGVSAYEKLKLAAENWDVPIVVTTNVQFFESLFASRKSRSRKLHNIAKSVVIFDEVQMLPREFLRPCLLAMSDLVHNYGVSIVLSTATQPALQDFFPSGVTFTELAPDPPALFDFYRRVRVTNLGKLTDEALLARLNEHPQVLCIVNTRRHAKGLFDGLTGEGSFHLSTLMCPTHRKATLAEIRARLENDQPCRVVSTQVMEAGIDVDFPVGYRAMAGLDSIIQAAGRVNRENRRPSGDIFVFEPQTEFIRRTPTFVEQTAAVARAILRDFADDPTTIAAIRAYYQQLYALQDEKAFDVRQILNCFDKGTKTLDFDFKTAAENFKLIDDNTIAVIIPYNEEAKQLLNTLKYTPYPSAVLRKLQLFSVNIYEREFAALQSQGAIQTIHERYHALDERWMSTAYHFRTGLVLPQSNGGEAVFFD